MACALAGTRLALRRVRSAREASERGTFGLWLARRRAPAATATQEGDGRDRPGISVIKPVKGAEAGLEECLLSCFQLTYPRFELLFCAADSEDPAIPIVKALIARHPRVRAKLHVGAVDLGLNPKANNMAKSYEDARYDWILVSDSNVRLQPDLLQTMEAEFDESVGVLTSVVVGVEARSWAGRLEAAFLNSYYARWMALAERCNVPCVIGKAMLFRRSQADRFGGLRALSRYLAEDYMAGKAMALLGLSTRICSRPAVQPIGALSFRAFWSRHLRWGRIRRSQAPQAHALEILASAVPTGALGAYGLQEAFGVSFAWAWAAHVLVWGACDAVQMRALSGRYGWRDPAAWLARELLAVPLWLHAVSGRTVVWRGRKLKLGTGGLLIEEGPRSSDGRPVASPEAGGAQGARA